MPLTSLFNHTNIFKSSAYLAYFFLLLFIQQRVFTYYVPSIVLRLLQLFYSTNSHKIQLRIHHHHLYFIGKGNIVRLHIQNLTPEFDSRICPLNYSSMVVIFMFLGYPWITFITLEL